MLVVDEGCYKALEQASSGHGLARLNGDGGERVEPWLMRLLFEGTTTTTYLPTYRDSTTGRG
jgi:hypothetical protein